MKRFGLALFASFSFLVCSGVCGAHPKGWFSHSNRADLLHGKWTLVQLENKHVPASPQVWIEFTENGKVSGYGGINTFNGTYEFSKSGARVPSGPPALHVEGAHLELSALAATKKAGDPRPMEQEGRLMELLSEVDHYSVTSDSRLRMFHVGRPVLEFERHEISK